MKNQGSRFIAAAAVAVAVMSPAAFGATIYDSTEKPLPGNEPSVGAEAYSFTQLGDEVTFAKGPRKLDKVTVTLSSWACQSGSWVTANCVTKKGAKFKVPITLNIYSVGDGATPGPLVTSMTRTFDVAYRPSADPRCTGGRWFDGPEGCFNGIADNVTFDFGNPAVVLPESVVYGISYNTTHHGPNPIGESAACYTSSGGCPYDSLNIALAPEVRIGSKPFPDTLYWDTTYVTDGNVCDQATFEPGIFQLDSAAAACWVGYVPAVQFKSR